MSRLSALLTPYSPERTAELTGVPAWRIQSLARDFASQRPSLGAGGLGWRPARARQRPLRWPSCYSTMWPAISAGPFALKPTTDRPRPSPPARSTISSRPWRTAMSRSCCWPIPTRSSACPGPAGFPRRLNGCRSSSASRLLLMKTTAQADLVLPDHSPLESWGDHSPRPGVHSLMQPVMAPVFDTRPMGDVLLSTAAQVGPGELGSSGTGIRRSSVCPGRGWLLYLSPGLVADHSPASRTRVRG